MERVHLQTKCIDFTRNMRGVIPNVRVHFLGQRTSEIDSAVISSLEAQIIRKEYSIGSIAWNFRALARNEQILNSLNGILIKRLAENRVFSKGALLCTLLFDLHNSIES